MGPVNLLLLMWANVRQELFTAYQASIFDCDPTISGRNGPI